MAGTFAFREMFRAITRIDWVLRALPSGRRIAVVQDDAGGTAREAHSFVSRLQGSARSFVYLISNGGIGSDSPDFIALSRAADLTGSTHQ